MNNNQQPFSMDSKPDNKSDKSLEENERSIFDHQNFQFLDDDEEE